MSTRKCKVTYVAGILFLQDGTVLAIVRLLSPVRVSVTPWTAAVQHSIDNNGYLGDRCRGSEVKTVHAFFAIFYFFTRGRGAHLRAQALEQSAWPWVRRLTSEHLGFLTHKLGSEYSPHRVIQCLNAFTYKAWRVMLGPGLINISYIIKQSWMNVSKLLVQEACSHVLFP